MAAPGLLADVNVQGHVEVLLRVLESSEWAELWRSLQATAHTFADVGLSRDAKDVEVWRLCQERQLLLVTANRNNEGADSLEATISTARDAAILGRAGGVSLRILNPQNPGADVPGSPISRSRTIQTENTAASLPVLTLADAEKIRHSRTYAEQVVLRLLEYLTDIENCRGTGRLYLP